MRLKTDAPNGYTFPYRLAAIDIDDTLVGHDKRISGANREAVGRLRSLGVRVCLASGRRHDNMLPFHQEMELDGYLISTQGALVRHPGTGEVVHEQTLTSDQTQKLIREGREYGATILRFGSDGVYSHKKDRWTDTYSNDAGDDPVRFVDFDSLPDFTPLKMIWAADPKRIDELAPEMATRYAGRLCTCITNPYYLEFNALEAHKAAGVQAVATRYGVAAEQTMAFGDGNNDVQMLSWAGLGVAMHGGQPAAKAAARRVSPPGDPGTALARAIDAIIEEIIEADVA